MEYRDLHPWDVTPRQALEIQKELCSQVQIVPLTRPVRYIAGADISFEKFTDEVYAGFVVIDQQDLKIVAQASVVTKAKFPYIPGLFSFREAPPLLEAWQKLAFEPDLVVLDGQGLAHPRRFGLACHMGLLLDRPTIGCAKSILVGKFQDLAEMAGSTAPLIDKRETVGVALRTKHKVQPVYLSVGHQITLADAIKVMMSTVKGYRIPEPTRQAHLFVNQIRQQAR